MHSDLITFEGSFTTQCVKQALACGLIRDWHYLFNLSSILWEEFRVNFYNLVPIGKASSIYEIFEANKDSLRHLIEIGLLYTSQGDVKKGAELITNKDSLFQSMSSAYSLMVDIKQEAKGLVKKFTVELCPISQVSKNFTPKTLMKELDLILKTPVLLLFSKKFQNLEALKRICKDIKEAPYILTFMGLLLGEDWLSSIRTMLRNDDWCLQMIYSDPSLFSIFGGKKRKRLRKVELKEKKTIIKQSDIDIYYVFATALLNAVTLPNEVDSGKPAIKALPREKAVTYKRMLTSKRVEGEEKFKKQALAWIMEHFSQIDEYLIKEILNKVTERILACLKNDQSLRMHRAFWYEV